jgi:pimeloyl-ACP methyl ester carboxylesterase
MSPDVPLILLSGMAADARLFDRQREAFPSLRVPPWIEPAPAEPLATYARRLAARVDPGVPCFVGGASFGGMVALEMARHLPALGCFLIASVRSPRELPWRLRLLRPLALLGPAPTLRLAHLLLDRSGPVLPPGARLDLRRFTSPDGVFVRWACHAVLTWDPRPGPPPIPVHHIHGARDRTLPVRYTRPDVVVAGAGHLLPATHAREVNAFLRRHMAAKAVR